MKEPKKPITKKYLASEDAASFWFATKIPITRHPIIFTKKVPMGNPIKEIFDKKDDIKYREIAPSPPPKPIIK